MPPFDFDSRWSLEIVRSVTTSMYEAKNNFFAYIRATDGCCCTSMYEAKKNKNVQKAQKKTHKKQK
jgi:hypothetical protein